MSWRGNTEGQLTNVMKDLQELNLETEARGGIILVGKEEKNKKGKEEGQEWVDQGEGKACWMEKVEEKEESVGMIQEEPWTGEWVEFKVQWTLYLRN